MKLISTFAAIILTAVTVFGQQMDLEAIVAKASSGTVTSDVRTLNGVPQSLLGPMAATEKKNNDGTMVPALLTILGTVNSSTIKINGDDFPLNITSVQTYTVDKTLTVYAITTDAGMKFTFFDCSGLNSQYRFLLQIDTDTGMGHPDQQIYVLRN